MAEILQGIEQHKSHAPLSHAQTIGVCRYLHDISQENASKVEDMKAEMGTLRQALDATRSGVFASQSAIADVRKEVSDRSAELLMTREMASRNEEQGKRLLADVGQNKRGIEEVVAGQKMTNTNVHVLKQSVRAHVSDFEELRKDVETVVHGGLATLGEKIRLVALKAQQLADEHSAQRTVVWACQDRVTSLEVRADDASTARAALAEASERHKFLLSDVAHRCEDVKANLELTNGVIMKIQDSHEEAQTSVASLREDHRSTAAKATKLDGDHANTASVAEQNRVGHFALIASHGSLKADVDQLTSQLQGLKEGFHQSGGSLKRVCTTVEQLRIQAACTEENLKVTNSYVLPNLDTGLEVDPKFAASSSTSIASQSPRRGGTKPARRKEKDAAWVVRNIGNTPDRMAWI